MKTLQNIKQTCSDSLLMAVALLAASSAFAIAGEKQAAQPTTQNRHAPKLSEQRIELPAMNGIASSVTVWTPQATSENAKPSRDTNKVVKEMNVHVPNSPNASIAVWIGR